TSALAVTTGVTTAAQVQANLQTIPALAGSNIAVTGSAPTFTITFGGALQGDVPQIASSNAAQATTATPTSGAPTAAQVQTNLNTIAALNGNVTVTGAAPIYTVTFGGALAFTDAAQIASSSTAQATTATTADGSG